MPVLEYDNLVLGRDSTELKGAPIKPGKCWGLRSHPIYPSAFGAGRVIPGVAASMAPNCDGGLLCCTIKYLWYHSTLDRKWVTFRVYGKCV